MLRIKLLRKFIAEFKEDPDDDQIKRAEKLLKRSEKTLETARYNLLIYRTARPELSELDKKLK